MPKTKIVAVKSTKKKLSPAERSQIAKDRWAKRRATMEDAYVANADSDLGINGPSPVPAPHIVEQDATPTSQPAIEIPGIAPIDGVKFHKFPTSVVSAMDAAPPIEVTPVVYRQNPDGSFIEIPGGVDIGQDQPPVAVPNVAVPAPKLAPVKVPKQKRYTGPKEFSVALKAAENRLAKAIVERAQAAGQLAALQAEIPSLLSIIQALKGSGNYAPPTAYDISGSYPNAQAFQAPIAPSFQPYLNPVQAAQAAQPSLPVSRAVGNAVQFGPDVLGALEGPEDDDDQDRYIKGPNAGAGWIGG